MTHSLARRAGIGYDFGCQRNLTEIAMPIVFILKSQPNLPLDVRTLVPNVINGMTVDQIRNLQIGFGNRTALVSTWFEVSGESNDQLVFRGTLDNVHAIGHSMTMGRIEIHGSAGRHVGASMSGGEVVVRGNLADYLGYEMQGGSIVVHGDAADHVGGCYPGAKYGMNRGTILISGSAGKGLGHRMRRGTIVVGGDTGPHSAWQMRAGTIMVLGSCVGPTGIDMKRGTILVGGSVEPAVTFTQGHDSNSAIVKMLLRWLAGEEARLGVKFPEFDSEQFKLSHGDFLAGSRGELFSAAI